MPTTWRNSTSNPIETSHITTSSSPLRYAGSGCGAEGEDSLNSSRMGGIGSLRYVPTWTHMCQPMLGAPAWTPQRNRPGER